MKKTSLSGTIRVTFPREPGRDISISDCLFDCHLLFILNRETKDDNLEQELSLADRRNKREIRMLEGEIPLWQVIVEKLNAASKTMLKYSLIAP